MSWELTAQLGASITSTSTKIPVPTVTPGRPQGPARPVQRPPPPSEPGNRGIGLGDSGIRRSPQPSALPSALRMPLSPRFLPARPQPSSAGPCPHLSPPSSPRGPSPGPPGSPQGPSPGPRLRPQRRSQPQPPRARFESAPPANPRSPRLPPGPLIG